MDERRRSTGHAATSIKEQELVISRIFNAPRERVWEAWSKPDIFKKWWGPKGFSCPVAKIDFRKGGKYINCMKSPDGQEFWSTGTYREIVEPEKIVATDSFADDQGNVVHAEHYGMSKDFPLEMIVNMIFEDQNGKTKFTLRHIGIPNLDMLNATRDGWNESFDKLSDLLEDYDELR